MQHEENTGHGECLSEIRKGDQRRDAQMMPKAAMGPRYGMKLSTPASTPQRIAFGMPSAYMASAGGDTETHD